MNVADIERQVEALIRGPQYARTQAEKDAALTAILRGLCRDMAARCPAYGRFLDHNGPPPEDWRTLAAVPPLPVAMFKRFLLSAVPPERIVRELHSSATTGQQPSRIVVDKTTAFRQARALVSILKEHVGGRRRPLLVLDAAESVAAGDSLSARGATIRGIGNFASETVFGMKQAAAGELEPDWDAIEAFCARHRDDAVLLFGFTYIVWSGFVLEAERRGLHFQVPQAVLLHSGGWKKLTADAVTKEEFTRRVGAVLGADPRQVLDFYGMVEQVGTVLVDCPAGHKHAPAFADVLVRRSCTLAPAGLGELGILEVLSALPTSYPGHALLTEDQGVMLGVDDCPCGRRGSYFRFVRRIEEAEVRGCGDTFAQAREIR
jgi:hypothetical protein